MTVNASTLARKFAVANKTVHAWVKEGCPRNADKSFDVEKVLAWRRAKLGDANADPAVKMMANKTALQTKRLMLQCEVIETGLLKERGRLHDKDACAKSLTEVRARESQILHGLHQRFAGAFPEATKQAEWIEREVGEIVARLNHA